jgi:hypothetical protein
VRAPGYSWSTIRSEIWDKVRSQVSQQMQEADSSLLSELSSQFASSCGLSSYSVRPMVERYLRHNDPASLADAMASHEITQHKNKISSTLLHLRGLGFGRIHQPQNDRPVRHSAPLSDTSCGWVPAAFRKDLALEGYRRVVYGGVSLNISFVNAKLANPPPTSTYHLSATTLNTQRSLAAPNSNAQQMDNLKAFNQAFFRNQQEARAAAARAYPPNFLII